MDFGITFGQLNPGVWEDVATEADRLGFESLWLPEHLVFPLEVRGELVPGEEHPPVPSSTPVYDAPSYLSYIAAKTGQIKLGTFVYLLGIRHPFVSARGFATLDVVSGGRAIVGVGAGWLVTEWEAAGLDPRTRGRRLDEAMAVCRRLWTDEVIEHDGEFFSFPPVMFEPKPVQQPHPPILVGGESDRALRRAATADGWIGMQHTPESARAQATRLEAHWRERDATAPRPTVTVMGAVKTPDDVEAYAAAGVDRLIVVPWRRSSEAVDGIRAFAGRFLQ